MIKRIFSLVLFCVATTFALNASPSVEPLPETETTTVSSITTTAADLVLEDACTLSGEFTTDSGATYQVTVTAPSCGGAARVLQAVGDAIDEM